MWDVMALAMALWAAPSAHAGEWVKVDGPRAAAMAPEKVVTAGAGLPPLAVAGGRMLSMDPVFVDHAIRGIDLLYQRRYRDTRAFFAELDGVFPGTTTSAIADVLVWQAVMLENFDFRFDAQYQAASQRARAGLTAALEEPGAEAWEHFMLAGVAGIEAIHAARQGRYLPALALAFEAMGHVESTRAAAPAFVDLALADGLYNYWRTVLTEQSKVLPSFGDKKEAGIAQMTAVEAGGVFLAPPATLALAFSWVEEREYDKAIAACERNKKKYPGNLINELMLGTSHLYRRAFDDAIRSFERVREIDPKNVRSLYYEGVAWLRKGEVAKAEERLRAYLAAEALESWQRSGALWRLGQAAEKRDDVAAAEAAYKQAIAVDGNKYAKAALDALRKAARR